jgi:hypothetical protein
MDIFFDETASYLIDYLNDDLIKVIFSYLIKFNIESLFLEKSYDIPQLSLINKINVFNNKIYFPLHFSGLIIIYDMKINETFYLDTELNKYIQFLV